MTDFINASILTPSSQLVDVGRLSGKKRTASHKTTMNHFQKFLEFTDSSFTCFEDMPEDKVCDEILGFFSDYLKNHVTSVKSYNTHDSYISNLYNEIVDKFPLKKQLFCSYYTKLRLTIKNKYLEVQDDEGIPLPISNHSKQMKFTDLEYICRQLFVENNF